jgi:myosin heavy subunit
MRGYVVADTVRFAKVGFPEHIGYGEFRRRYDCLMDDNKM